MAMVITVVCEGVQVQVIVIYVIVLGVCTALIVAFISVICKSRSEPIYPRREIRSISSPLPLGTHPYSKKCSYQRCAVDIIVWCVCWKQLLFLGLPFMVLRMKKKRKDKIGTAPPFVF